MSTPAEAPAGARPVAVAAVPIVTMKQAAADPSRHHELRQVMTVFHQVTHGTSVGRASGQPGLPDVQLHGTEGAVLASRERISGNDRLVEVVGVGKNDAAATQQAAEALGRNPSQPVPGLEAYGDRSEPAATVDDRTAVLENRTVQNGLSTGSPTQQTSKGGIAAKDQIGSRVQSPQQDPRAR